MTTGTAVGRTRAGEALDRLAARVSRLRPRQEVRLIVLATLALTAACAALLVGPGRTFSNIYAHDIFIFLDGAHRVLDGQTPNRDFHTPLGLLAYLLPAAGLWLTGTAGGMMPVATALFLVALCPALAYVAASRLPVVYALLFVGFSVAAAATPAAVGEGLPSFAMFYNRWGYVLLGLLFALALPVRRGPARTGADAAVAAFVLLATFYLKVSYLAVAAVFTLLLLTSRQTRKAAALALVAAGLGVALVHLAWGGTAGYLDDLRVAAASSGVLRGTVGLLVSVAVQNVATIVPFGLVLAIAAIRGASWRTLLLCLYMAGAGLALANQNTQVLGILTLIPAAIVAALAVRNRDEPHPGTAPALLALVATLALPPTFSGFDTVARHALNASRGGRPALDHVASLDGFYAAELRVPPAGTPGLETVRSAYRDGTADLGMVNLVRALPIIQILAQPEYLWTLQDAIRLVRERPELGGKILTLDMVSPLNALLRRSAPRGVDSWYHDGRTFSATTYRSADTVFADVDVVMVPKAPVTTSSYDLLVQLYGERLRRDYDVVATSDYWRAYARKVRRAGTGTSPG